MRVIIVTRCYDDGSIVMYLDKASRANGYNNTKPNSCDQYIDGFGTYTSAIDYVKTEVDEPTMFHNMIKDQSWFLQGEGMEDIY